MKRITCNQQGFTLVEIMIAIMVFAFGIVAAASMQTASMGGNSVARNITEATNLASERQELMTYTPYDALVSLDVDGDNDGQAGLDDEGVPGAADGADGQELRGNYTISWNIAPDFPVPNTITMRALVTSNQGAIRTVVIDSMKIQTIVK